jgi:hypothetical protein
MTKVLKTAKSANVIGWQPSNSQLLHVTQVLYWRALELRHPQKPKAANGAHAQRPPKTANSFGGRS